MEEDKSEIFFEKFKKQNPKYSEYETPISEAFANTEEAANQIAQLILKGKKTATCSAKIAYELEEIDIPKIGDLLIITDWNENPICIIETLSVTIKKFEEIDESWAKQEGEGDLSLTHWKKVHLDFFTTELEIYGLAPTNNMELVCETFRKIG